MRFVLAILLAPILFAAGQDPVLVQLAGRNVAVWTPPVAAPAGGYPVVVFSHGFTGCSTQSTFLMKALARAGYLVLAPDHKDAACGPAGANRERGSVGKLLSIHPEQPFGHESDWSPATYRDRADDIEAILGAISHAPAAAGAPADLSRVGLAGHSLGGYTVLGLGGAWPSWKDARVKAVLALSPYCAPYIMKGALEGMDVPVMYQGGTLDAGITPTVRKSNGAFEKTPAPKYYVEFRGAGHFAWTNLNPSYQDLINRYSVAFFDRYLRNGAAPDTLSSLMAKPLPGKVSDARMKLP